MASTLSAIKKNTACGSSYVPAESWRPAVAEFLDAKPPVGINFKEGAISGEIAHCCDFSAKMPARAREEVEVGENGDQEGIKNKKKVNKEVQAIRSKKDAKTTNASSVESCITSQRPSTSRNLKVSLRLRHCS